MSARVACTIHGQCKAMGRCVKLVLHDRQRLAVQPLACSLGIAARGREAAWRLLRTRGSGLADADGPGGRRRLTVVSASAGADCGPDCRRRARTLWARRTDGCRHVGAPGLADRRGAGADQRQELDAIAGPDPRRNCARTRLRGRRDSRRAVQAAGVRPGWLLSGAPRQREGTRHVRHAAAATAVAPFGRRAAHPPRLPSARPWSRPGSSHIAA